MFDLIKLIETTFSTNEKENRRTLYDVQCCRYYFCVHNGHFANTTLRSFSLYMLFEFQLNDILILFLAAEFENQTHCMFKMELLLFQNKIQFLPYSHLIFQKI